MILIRKMIEMTGVILILNDIKKGRLNISILYTVSHKSH